MNGQSYTGTNLQVLKKWAEDRGLRVFASSGNQRDPENVVAIMDGDGPGAPRLVSRQSLDSVDTAAMYVLNTIRRLMVEPKPGSEQ